MTWTPSPGSQADVARADGPAGRLADAFSSEWRWWDHRDRWQALFFRVHQADGATSGFWGPELQIDVGELAIWAMGAGRAAITKQEAALTVLRTMRALSERRRWQAAFRGQRSDASFGSMWAYWWLWHGTCGVLRALDG